MTPTAAEWHAIEHSGYSADLPAWTRLVADTGACSIAELGAGVGRVALHLAGRGHRLTVLDSDPTLLDALKAAAPPAATVECVEATAPDLPRIGKFDAVIAPTAFIQIIGGTDERVKTFTWTSRSLAKDGIAAFAVSDPVPGIDLESAASVAPDSLTVHGQNLESRIRRIEDLGESHRIERERCVDGCRIDLTEERLSAPTIERLHDEAAAAGLTLHETIRVHATGRHAAMSILVFDAR